MSETSTVKQNHRPPCVYVWVQDTAQHIMKHFEETSRRRRRRLSHDSLDAGDVMAIRYTIPENLLRKMLNFFIMKLIWRFIIALGPMSNAMLARQSIQAGTAKLDPSASLWEEDDVRMPQLGGFKHVFGDRSDCLSVVTATKVAGLHDGCLGGWTRFCQGECSCLRVVHWRGQCANLHPETLKDSEREIWSFNFRTSLELYGSLRPFQKKK